MPNENSDYPPVRRIVTGHDANHVAKVLIDGAATNAKYPAPGIVSTMIWCTDRMPADIAVGETPEDIGGRVIGTPPPPSGTRFAVIDFPPGNAAIMHRTETLDYVVMIEGELVMDMDDSTVKLKGGHQKLLTICRTKDPPTGGNKCLRRCRQTPAHGRARSYSFS
jgi:hypothetical protein